MPAPDNKKRDLLILIITLFLFWLLLNGSLAVDVIVTGIVVSALITVLFYQGLSFFTELRLTPAAILAGFRYYVYFFGELLRSNLKMAKIVITPSLPIQPAIVRVRTRLKSRMGRLMLANSITLTPGTLTVDMQGEWLYIHCVYRDETAKEQDTHDLIAGFESYLEVMYG